MSISTRIYAEHPDLALSHTIRELPEVTIGVRSDAGTDPVNDEYAFWIEAPDFDAVDDALTDDPTVAAFSTLDDGGDVRTYRITYSDQATLVTPTILDMGGLTQEARSHESGWMLRLHLRDHDALVALDSFAEEHDIRLEILDLQHDTDPPSESTYGLTDAQIEALLAGYEHGYFDDPRQVTLEELASKLDVSNSALSGRLRRGYARLVDEVLIEDEE